MLPVDGEVSKQIIDGKNLYRQLNSTKNELCAVPDRALVKKADFELLLDVVRQLLDLATSNWLHGLGLGKSE